MEIPTYSFSSGKYTDIYVNTVVPVLTKILACPDADMHADTSRCGHTCQHIEILAHSTSGDQYDDIYVNTLSPVLANMLTCPDADRYANTRC